MSSSLSETIRTPFIFSQPEISLQDLANYQTCCGPHACCSAMGEPNLKFVCDISNVNKLIDKTLVCFPFAEDQVWWSIKGRSFTHLRSNCSSIAARNLSDPRWRMLLAPPSTRVRINENSPGCSWATAAAASKHSALC